MDEMRKQFPLAACIDNKESESTEINKPEQVKAVLNTGALVKTIAEARLAAQIQKNWPISSIGYWQKK